MGTLGNSGQFRAIGQLWATCYSGQFLRGGGGGTNTLGTWFGDTTILIVHYANVISLMTRYQGFNSAFE
jgi:hypothetical protein